MKKLLTSTLLIAMITQAAYGEQSCPLTNAKLTNLRASASKLAQSITLSSECKAYQETVNSANAELKKVAEQVASLEDNPNSSNEEPDKEALALHAVGQLDTISSLFKDKRCGQELAGFLDYSEAFVDVANGMSPFLAIYGGPAAMPWVLGSAVGGAAIKTLIMFFKNKKINMRNPDQSSMFVKNSCSFYNLDLIKSSLDDLELNQLTKIERELIEARRKYKELEKSPPAEPKSDLVMRVKTAEKDQERVKYLQDHFKIDPLEACVYIQIYASETDATENGSMVERVWKNYADTISGNPFRLQMEEGYFLNDLNKAAATGDPAKCKEIGNRWLIKINALSDNGLAQLKKKASEDPEVVTFEKWKSDKTKAEENIKVLEGKIKFFQEMTGQGFNIEFSEIIRSHQLVQDSIFASYKYLAVLRMKGLAEAWLRVKQEDAHQEYRSFFNRKKDVEKRLKRISGVIGSEVTPEAVYFFANSYFKYHGREHRDVHKSVLVDVCSQLRQTWNSWYNGLIHSKAGKDYCVTFDKVINRLDYPAVQNLCFGTSKKVGHRLSSLKNQVRDFHSIKPEADKIALKMKELSCSNRGDFSQDLLTLPLQ